MRRYFTLFAVALIVASGFRATAQDPRKGFFDQEKAFRAADGNSDGALTRDEFLRFAERMPALKDQPQRAGRLFSLLDANADGSLGLEEFRRFATLRGSVDPAAGKNEPQASGQATPERAPTSEELAFFEKKIRPVLVDHCYKCHSAEAAKPKANLLVDSREGLRRGGDSGPALVPGDLKRSLILKALRHEDDNLKMPAKKLSPEMIADFEAWVKMGAPDPRTGAAPVVRGDIDIEKGRSFWAFQAPQAYPAPPVANAAWPRGDLDRFLLASLEKNGLAPAPDADKPTLLRRAYLDLIGLPPTPEELEAFLRDSSPDAFAQVVDRLLASPRFGERWGRHWLDIARYGETSGKQVNVLYPHAWRYRDYVIAAFNEDKPYAQFIREQLAGDLLPARDAREKALHQIATGFLSIGSKSHNERNRLQFAMDLVDEQIDVTTQAFLGLTVACARCHDHKFDPIPQTDYYAMAGIFRSTETCFGTAKQLQNVHFAPLLALKDDSGQAQVLSPLGAEQRKSLEKQIAEAREKRQALFQERKFATPEAIRTGAVIDSLTARLNQYHDDGTPKLQAMGVRERSFPSNSPLYKRGEVDKPGATVPRGLVQVVSRKSPSIKSGSGRLELANWIASPENPLTARVMVNRVWLHLFGRGIVPTPDNFGAMGQPPTHPELLDHLALAFQADGWSVKKLIRRIVLSHAYQQGSDHHAAHFQRDPDNALVWRMSKRRLDAEVIRDSLLYVSGKLNLTPAVGSAIAREGDGSANFLQRRGPLDASFEHRAVYLPIPRNLPIESLSLFDFADPSLVVAERSTTTVPAQSLYLLNSPFVLQQAQAAATRLLGERSSDEDRIRLAYLRFFGRAAEVHEVRAAQAFLASYAGTLRNDFNAQTAPWSAFCQALMASAEFLNRN